jgi:hypothetical protein
VSAGEFAVLITTDTKSNYAEPRISKYRDYRVPINPLAQFNGPWMTVSLLSKPRRQEATLKSGFHGLNAEWNLVASSCL